MTDSRMILIRFLALALILAAACALIVTGCADALALDGLVSSLRSEDAAVRSPALQILSSQAVQQTPPPAQPAP